MGSHLFLINLRKQDHVVLPVRFGTVGAGGVGKIQLLQVLALGFDVILHLHSPFAGVLVRAFEDFGQVRAGQGSHLRPRNGFGYVDVDVRAPERIVAQHELAGCLGLGLLDERHVFRDLAAHVQGDMEETGDVVRNEGLMVPGDFLVLPGLGIEGIAAAGVLDFG